MLDLHAITAEQRERLIKAIAERFSIPVEEVEREIEKGVPILAEDVSVSSSDQGTFFSLADFQDDNDFWGSENPNEDD